MSSWRRGYVGCDVSRRLSSGRGGFRIYSPRWPCRGVKEKSLLDVSTRIFDFRTRSSLLRRPERHPMKLSLCSRNAAARLLPLLSAFALSLSLLLGLPVLAPVPRASAQGILPPGRSHREADRRAVRRSAQHQPRTRPRQHAHHRRPALSPVQRRGRHPQPHRHGRDHQRPHLQRTRRRRREGHRHRRHPRHGQGHRFRGQPAHQEQQAAASGHAQKGQEPQRGNRRDRPPEAPGLLPRQGFQRRGHQEQHRQRRHHQLGHDHLHHQRGRQEQPRPRVFRGQQGHQDPRPAPRHEGHPRQGHHLLHRQERPARPGQAQGRPRQRPRPLPGKGLHRHRHPRDPRPTPDQRRREPRRRRARGAAVPRRHAHLRGHADLHRHRNQAVPQDEGGRALHAQGPEGRPQDHRGLLRLARLRGHARHPRGPAHRRQQGQPPLQDRRGRPVLRRARQHRRQHPDQGQGHPPGNPPRPRRHLQHRARRGRQEAPGKPRLL